MRHRRPAATRLPLTTAGLATLLLGSVALAQATTPPATTPPSSPPADLPPADLPPAAKIVEQSVRALGGAEALGSVESIQYQIKAVTPQGETPVSVRTARKDRVLIDVTMPAGQMQMGRHGKVAWTNDAMRGYSLVPEEEAGQVSQLDLYGFILGLKARAIEYETVDRTDFDGAACHKVRLSKSGSPVKTFGFFDAADGTLRGLEQVQPSPTGPMVMTTQFMDHEEFAPLTLFTKATISVGPAQLATLQMSEVKFNVVESDAFDVPAEVQTLLEGRKAAATQPATQPAAPAAGRKGEMQPALQQMLERLETIEDVAQLRMIASMLEAQKGQVAEEERAEVEFVIEKIRERIAKLEGAGAGGDSGGGG